MKKRMKRILSVLFALTMIFGMAANAMGEHDFSLMTINGFRGLETVDTFDSLLNGWGNLSLPPAGTTIEDIFDLDDFGAISYSEFETVAMSNFEYMPDYSGQRAWIAIQKDATPDFDQSIGAFMTAYTNVFLYHDGPPEVKPFGLGIGIGGDGMVPLNILGGFENNGVASVNLDNILTQDILMDIWQLDLTVDYTGNVMDWEKSGFDLKIYNSGGTELGTERIDAAIISAVPIPGAVWLLSSGFLALVGVRRKRS